MKKIETKITPENGGFTLVELAIALMVIGLLIGGVLKGQELIENARATALMRQVKAYDTAVMIFRSSYNALPGDINNPGTRLPNCTTGSCASGGNRNGLVYASGDSVDEYYNFFTHMTKAGVIQGPEGGIDDERATAPEKFHPEASGYGALVFTEYFPDGTEIGLSGGVKVQPGHFYLIPDMPIKAMALVDAKMDDGFPCTGDVFPKEAMGCAGLSENGYITMQTERSLAHDTFYLRSNF